MRVTLVPPRRRQLPLDLPTEQDMVSLTDMDAWERMVADYGLLGLSPSYHPLGLLRPSLPPDVLTAAQVHASPDGGRVRTAGLVVCRQRPGTAKGFVFLLIEDETGVTNVVVRPDFYEAHRALMRGEPYLCIDGAVQRRSGSLNLLAQNVTPLAASARRPPTSPPPSAVSSRGGAAHAGPVAPTASLLPATPGSHDFF